MAMLGLAGLFLGPNKIVYILEAQSPQILKCFPNSKIENKKPTDMHFRIDKIEYGCFIKHDLHDKELFQL